MAAHLIRLKLTLLRNQLKGSVGQVIGLVASVAFGGMGALGVAGGLVYLRTMPVDQAAVWTTVLGGALVLAWALAPVANVGQDQTLDPARFVTFAVPRRQLVTGLLAGSVISVPALVTAGAALGTAIVWSRDVVGVVVALVGGAIGLLTCLVAARTTGTLIAVLQSGRRFREVVVTVGFLLVIGVSFVPFMLTQGVVRLSVENLDAVADVVAWTPLGWVWSAPADAVEGRFLLAVAKLVLGAALVPLLMRAWGALLDRQLVRGGGSGGRSVVRRRQDLRMPVPGAAGAVAGRCLTYWVRDPRYTMSLAMVVLLPVLMLVLVPVGIMSLTTWALLLAPVLAFFLGWGLHNDVAYDADPWWMHLAAHVPGTADRAGRVLASAAWGVPLLLVAAVGGGYLAGRPEMIPALVGGGLALAGAGYGISSVAAVVAPYWAPAPGENPNATPPGGGGQMMLAQMITGSATVALTLPAVVPFVLAWRGSTTASWVTLVLGLAVGAVATWVGVRVGGRLMDRRGPELLATVRR